MDKYDKYVGQIFDRRYRIVRIIGVGGMAVVFEAVDTVMKRTVAVKMLKEEIAGDAQAVKRFINESRAVSMLSHPNIVSIYDVSVRDDLKYIVMERVDGITLKNYMNSRGPLPPKEIMNYTAQILRALDHAHSKGIIHRDIKPQNIMLLKNGKIKVTDFGIAKLPNAETVTMTDKAIGTVYYISPEQASGKKIDPRSDIYSLGVVMYEMATGKLPFVADSPVSVALMQVNNQPRPPRELLPRREAARPAHGALLFGRILRRAAVLHVLLITSSAVCENPSIKKATWADYLCLSCFSFVYTALFPRLFRLFDDLFHIQPMVSLFRRREQIQPVALAHVFHVLPAGGIGALVHNQRVGARALEVHLPVDKAVLRADGNRQIALPPAVKPRRIKRGSLAAGGTGQAHQALIRQRVRLKHVRRGQ